MTAKKRATAQEPLLNTMARKLGMAAGSLTKATKELAENISALPESVTSKVREVAHSGKSAKPASTRARHPKKKSGTRTRKAAAKVSGRTAKRKSPKGKRAQGSRKSSKSKA